METLLPDGTPVVIERKLIRNLYVRVKPPDGRVEVTAPRFASAAAIDAFLRDRLSWIQKHRAAYAAAPPAPRYLSGERHPLWGVAYRLQVAEAEKRASAFCDGDRIVLRVPLGSGETERKRALDAWYKKRLLEAVGEETAPCEAAVGARASGWRVRDMTSRWGTCNVKTGMITLNLQLVKWEPEFLRYVMVHELTHLLEPSHNQRFYRLMDRAHPGWQAVRKRLKQKGAN